jgi:hypothetical protein
MRSTLILLATAAAYLAAGHLHADCGKAPVVPPKVCENCAGQGEIATNQGKTDATPPPDAAGGSGSVDPDDPSFKVADIGVQQLASSRGFFKEPSQQAVIAWNGSEETLVLKTQEESMVGKATFIHYFPLPGEPIDIRKGDDKLFDNAYKLVETKLKRDGAQVASRNIVVLERTFGSRVVFVWRIDNIDEFQDKIQSYIFQKTKGKGKIPFTNPQLAMVRDYFSKGFKYWAFDLCTVGDGLSEKFPIEYHFKSKFVYYPMLVSTGGGKGETRVEMVVFTDERGVNEQVGKLRFADENNSNGEIMTLGRKSVTVSNAELANLHPGMAQLMGNRNVRARIWVIRGELENFKGDVMARLKE